MILILPLLLCSFSRLFLCNRLRDQRLNKWNILPATGAKLYNPLCLAMAKGFHWVIVSYIFMPNVFSQSPSKLYWVWARKRKWQMKQTFTVCYTASVLVRSGRILWKDATATTVSSLRSASQNCSWCWSPTSSSTTDLRTPPGAEAEAQRGGWMEGRRLSHQADTTLLVRLDFQWVWTPDKTRLLE